MGNWLAKTWKPGLLSAVQGLIIAVVTVVMMTEENPLAVFLSPSALLSKLTENSTLAFLVMATPMLMLFFWFTRALWLTVRYLGILIIAVLVIGGAGLIYLERNFPEQLERFSMDGWFARGSSADSLSAVFPNRTAAPVQTEALCQRIDCIRAGAHADKPVLPPTPAMPAVGN